MCTGIRLLLAEMGASENNKAFAISTIVAMYGLMGVFFVTVPAVAKRLVDSHDINHEFLKYIKYIGTFSAYLGPFSLLMVIVLPPKLNWIGYLVVCVMFGILVTCFHLDDGLDIRLFTFNDITIGLVMLVICSSLVALTIPSLDWIMPTVICVSLSIESAYHLITYLMFIYEKTSQRIQYNNDPQRDHYSYLMTWIT